jgi:SpoVK/Ycf46/Vps4 family AAA+-type ATPase
MKKKSIKKEAIFAAINTVYLESEGKIPNQELYTTLNKELSTLSNYTNLSSKEAYIFAVIFYVNLMGESSNINDLCKYFKTNTFSLLEVVDAIQSLCEKGIVKTKKYRPRQDNLLFNSSYTISKNISFNLLKGKEFPLIEGKKIVTEIELIEAFNTIGQQCIDGEIQVLELEDAVSDLLLTYSHFEATKFVKEYKLSHEEILVLYYVIWNTLCGQNGIDMDNLCGSIFKSRSQQVLFTQSMVQGSNPLIKNDLLEYVSTGFMNNFEASPSRKTADKLAEFDIIIKMPTSRRATVIDPRLITEKTLFYSEKEKQQMEAVHSILKEENYTQLIDRMQSKGMPQGVNVLLFGAPGTGKTESVLQLAKQSGREIVKVDISNTKSMWFGESEKIIKRIFNDYREYAKRCTIAPILFFNEADAVLSKRSSNSFSNTQQTENAIQNILLDELENFEGIFMATTNLMNNLDKAFERRFLYKVEFSVPTEVQRIAIWQSKFPTLLSEDCSYLAGNYELSGGQIDNVYRKSEINYILNNENVNLVLLKRFCEEEVNHTQSYTQIGFR